MSEKELTARKILLAEIAGGIVAGLCANPALTDMSDEKIVDYAVKRAKDVIEKVDAEG